MIVYFAKNLDEETVSRSSSGGFFSLLANYVINRGGVVFGATFNKEFNVEITYTENDFSGMLGSKYVKSSIGNSFAKCKEFLDTGRLVLYTGTPCQIVGLKAYLKEEYDNLITMDVICHGSPVAKIWQNYLKSFNKEIIGVNFRDKRESWEQYHLTIKFKDGTEFSENHHKNKYMKLFLENKILSEPCFKCKNCKNSVADFTVGDAWSAKFKNIKFNDHRGVSCIIVKTEKGNGIFDKLKPGMLYETVDESYLNRSVGYVHNYIKPADADRIKHGIIEPRIAIITIPGHENVGNTLQAFALQSKIKEILPGSSPIIIDQKYKNMNSFYKERVNYTDKGFNNFYDITVVGSDQIWTDAKYPAYFGVPFDDRFLVNNKSRKIVYAASFGKHKLNFTRGELFKISHSLKNLSFVSTRELSGTLICKHYFGYNKAIGVLDPTMLYDKEFYLSSIEEDPCSSKHGIFAYILDNNKIIEKYISFISKTLGEPILPYDGSVENFIKNMNNASCVITDSYHGTVFSLIFNNPFVTLRNEKRGNDRFDDLDIRFELSGRFVTGLASIETNLLKTLPNPNFEKYRKISLDFLYRGLYNIC